MSATAHDGTSHETERVDIAFVGGTLVSGGGRATRDIWVRDGRIVAVVEPGSPVEARTRVDARGLLILPGILDSHFHCRAPDHPEREDFDSGTAAAAAGGVTTILEMPISDPVCATPEVLSQRQQLARVQARIDVGFYAAPGDLDAPRLQEMVAAGAVAFKVMMHGFPAGRESSFRGLALTANRDIYRALERVRDTGLLVAVHCEDQDLIDLFESRERQSGGSDPLAHARSRPVMAEALAVARLGAMNEQVGAHVHVVHVSSGRALEYIRWFQVRGQRMTAETTPAYLFGSERDIEAHGPFVKVNPPLRPEADQAALWAGLHDTTLATIASDHAPFGAHEKEPGWRDIWNVGSGIPGVELTGPLLWDHALRGHVPLERVVHWTSEAPAQLFGLARQKGFVRPGNDADLILLDPSGERVLAAADFHTRSANALRHVIGRRCHGALVGVWSRGVQIADRGAVIGSPGHGNVVVPDNIQSEYAATRAMR
jgi:dihydroorotase (multifunctional complex type)